MPASSTPLPSAHRTSARRLGRALRLGVVALAVARPLAAQTFDFETTPASAATPLSITSAGVTATFTSPADPGAFVVIPTFLSPAMPGLVLARPASVAAPLHIAFSTALNFIGLNFAVNGAPSLTLDAYMGASLVGSVTVAGVVPPGFTFPQGSISLGAGSFDNVRLSAATEFAIDNVTVRTAAVVPEPSTWALAATGLAMIGAAARRRRRRADG